MNRRPQSRKVRHAAAAGLLYFLIVFSFGFLLGALRRSFVVPAVGELLAVLAELPIMLTIAWVVCGWVLSKLAVSGETLDRLVVGAAAFGLLMIAEAAVSITLAGSSLAEHLYSYGDTSEFPGLIGQLLFAAFPLLRRRTNGT